MVFRPTREKGSEDAERQAQIAEYRKKDEKLEQNSDGLALRSLKDRPDEVGETTKKLAYEAMGNLFERIKLLAELHGGNVQRLDAYPSELPLPKDKHVYLKPDAVTKRNEWIAEGDQMFVRLDVKGRTYVFFLPESGAVNVYENGEYKGGNHDLALFEINDSLERDDWFGVNG